MENKKTRILAFCDAPQVATGFGTVSRNILLGLHATGRYDIVNLGINYWGQPHNLPISTYPVGINNQHDPYGREWSKDMMKKLEYDILFTLQDSFILEFMKDVIDDLRAKNPNLRWINYFPVDGTPKKQWIDVMAMADNIFTYTEWGKSKCEEVCPEIVGRLGAIPHGVNVKDFFPTPKTQAESFRRLYFGALADKFVVCNVNRNQQRKDIPRSMVAFKKFKELRPNSVYYIHAAVEDHGWNLVEVAKALGLRLNVDICFPNEFGPNQGFPVDVVNNIYNACDVVISTTTGEGWGLAQTEAMACCKPVISPDNTACTEIVKDRGILIRSGWSPEAFTILPMDNEVVRPLASIEDLTEALVKLHDDRQLRSKLAVEGYKWVTSSLRWDKHIVPKWIEVFDDAAKFASGNDTKFGDVRPISIVEV